MTTKLPKNFISLAEAYPDIASEWDHDKNDLTPDLVSKGAHLKAWWIGKCGHFWYQSIEMRTRLGYGCPICKGTEILPGFNDLETLYPKLAKEWHPTKNGISAKEVGIKGQTKKWWICPKGHEWQYRIRDRILKNVRCEVCCNRRIVSGINDLYTVNPMVASEWHPDKNSFKAYEIGAGSQKDAWWRCSKGHEWKARISSRTHAKLGCPVCSNKKILVGFNDLLTTHPLLAKEWHPTKNEKLVTQVSKGISLKAWWLCDHGHEWQASVNNRSNHLQGCPYCTRQKVIAGENDFATTHPQFLKEWNFSKNSVLPSEFGWGSEKKVWWICAKGHEWENPIRNRVIGRNCPYCSNRAILAGFNDLVTLNPVLTKEWHPTKNLPYLPTEYGSGSAFKAWWICAKGHEWKSTIVNRHLQEKGCARCSKKGTSKSEIAFRKEFSSLLSKINKDHTTKIKLKGKDKTLQVDIIGEYKGKKIVIEYDGSLYHTQEKRIVADTENTRLLLDNNYIVVRIRENKLLLLDLTDENLFQISHRFSLELKDIRETTKKILEWLDN